MSTTTETLTETVTADSVVMEKLELLRAEKRILKKELEDLEEWKEQVIKIGKEEGQKKIYRTKRDELNEKLEKIQKKIKKFKRENDIS